MITGAVNTDLEAVLRLSVGEEDGRRIECDVVVDTGFNGSLTLPAEVITSLELAWRTCALVQLANGEEEACDIFAATVVWDGEPRQVLVESAETEPLVGMALLSGCDLQIQIRPGGRVVIEALRAET